MKTSSASSSMLEPETLDVGFKKKKRKMRQKLVNE